LGGSNHEKKNCPPKPNAKDPQTSKRSKGKKTEWKKKLTRGRGSCWGEGVGKGGRGKLKTFICGWVGP